MKIKIPLGVENTQKNFLDQRWSYARFEVQFSHVITSNLQIKPSRFCPATLALLQNRGQYVFAYVCLCIFCLLLDPKSKGPCETNSVYNAPRRMEAAWTGMKFLEAYFISLPFVGFRSCDML